MKSTPSHRKERELDKYTTSRGKPPYASHQFTIQDIRHDSNEKNSLVYIGYQGVLLQLKDTSRHHNNNNNVMWRELGINMHLPFRQVLSPMLYQFFPLLYEGIFPLEYFVCRFFHLMRYSIIAPPFFQRIAPFGISMLKDNFHQTCLY